MKKILTISSSKTYNFTTTKELVSFLGVAYECFNKVTLYAETEYTPILKIKKNGVDYRTIHAPSQNLKEIQHLIYEKILLPINLPGCVYGHSKGKTIIENAKYHSKNSCLINIDIIDFFPSVRYPLVQNLFKELFGSEKLSSEVTKLVTYKGVLPQGSPASPYLSALVLNNLDARLMQFSKKRGLRYTRYFDDISISGNAKVFSFEEEIFKIVESEGFNIHKEGDKISKFKADEVKIITGIQILPDGSLSVGDITEIENHVNQLKVNGVGNGKSENLIKEKQILQGKISFLTQVMPTQGQKIRASFELIDWGI